MNGQNGAGPVTKSERERAWEQVFLRLLSLERGKIHSLVFVIDNDGIPSGGVMSEGKLEWQGKRAAP